MSLRKLHKEFIELANRSMTTSKLPVLPKQSEVPIVPSTRWNVVDGGLVKKYNFRETNFRDCFVQSLFSYEQKIKHHAAMMVCAKSVIIRISTNEIDTVTELDKEYAAYCDILYKDIVTNSIDSMKDYNF